MKLYFMPGACSFAPHIILHEAGLKHEVDKLDRTTRKTVGGEDYNDVNPKGYVPALRLDDGQVLTEAAVILQYLADQKPESGLAPPAGTLARYRLMEWLHFISTEIHKVFSPLFKADITPAAREAQVAQLARRFDYVEQRLREKSFLMGDDFTVADAYLFTVASWSTPLNIDLQRWPKIVEYLARIGARPAVQAARKMEAAAK